MPRRKDIHAVLASSWAGLQRPPRQVLGRRTLWLGSAPWKSWMNSTNVLEKPASPCVPCVCLPGVCRQPCRQPQQSQEAAGVPALARTAEVQGLMVPFAMSGVNGSSGEALAPQSVTALHTYRALQTAVHGWLWGAPGRREREQAGAISRSVFFFILYRQAARASSPPPASASKPGGGCTGVAWGARRCGLRGGRALDK